jgi:pantothenate kinase
MLLSVIKEGRNSMSITTDDRRTFVSPLADFTLTIKFALQRSAREWLMNRQAALLRRVDQETRADIGYSHDYVRADWDNFAAEYPDTIAAAACVRFGRLRG